MKPFYRHHSKIHASIDFERENLWDFRGKRFEPELSCHDDMLRYIHFDLAESSDRVGFSMCHAPYHVTKEVLVGDRVGEARLPFLYFDFIGAIEVSKTEELDYQLIPEIVLDLRRRGYVLDLITFDRFQSSSIIQLLNSEGFRCGRLSIDRTAKKPLVIKNRKADGITLWNLKYVSTEQQYADAHNALKGACYDQRLNVPDWEIWKRFHSKDPRHPFVAEALGAEIVSDGKVDHGTHTKIDILSGMAGAAYNCQNNAPDLGDLEESLDPFKPRQQVFKEQSVNANNVYDRLASVSNMEQFVALSRELEQNGQVDLFDLMRSEANSFAELGL
jgi:hypothetical protein